MNKNYEKMSTYTSLSYGRFVYGLITTATGLPVYPVIKPEDGVDLPYVIYRRAAQEQTAVKPSAAPGSDILTVEVEVWASTYSSCVAQSERVRAALDSVQSSDSDLVMRSCLFMGAEEDYADDAYLQRMVFSLRVSPM